MPWTLNGLMQFEEILETVKQFEPLDALILEEFYKWENSESFKNPALIKNIMEKLETERDVTTVSIRHLENLGCLLDRGARKGNSFVISALGREILRAYSP